MIALYSVNLRVMGKANLPLLGIDTLFTQFGWISADKQTVIFAVGLVVVLLVGAFCYWFFGTEIGAAVRATGFNPNMIRANGVNTDATVILGLLLSNGLVAISGALVAQCIAEGTVLEALPLETYREYSPLFGPDVYDAIDLRACVARRKSAGGPTPESVEQQIAFVREAMGKGGNEA